MDHTSFCGFISEDNLVRHLSFLNDLKLKYSILEKSVPSLSGKDISEIATANLKRDIRDEAILLRANIKSHEVYFSSFGNQNKSCKMIRDRYGSEESFLYELYRIGLTGNCGFIYIYLDVRGIPRFHFSDDFRGAFIRFHPILAIDLYEHSYFPDYGFERGEYLKSALSHLNLRKLEESIDNRMVK